MMTLCWMYHKIRQDRIINKNIIQNLGLTSIVEKILKNRLRWFELIERRPIDFVVRRVDHIERRQTTKGKGRSKKTITKVIKKDLKNNNLDNSRVLNRTLWQKLIHVADFA